jgi:hypothetical protein
MLSHFLHPPLPPPQSWYPGHMTRFSRMLPALLSRTDVVLELRDARLPLTSVNRNFEGKLIASPSRGEERSFPTHHRDDADDNGVFCDPGRFCTFFA